MSLRPPAPTKIYSKQHYLKIKSLFPHEVLDQRSVIYHRGGDEVFRVGSDISDDFRQESNFFYLTGVDEPGFQVVIDMQTDVVYLVPPTVPDSDVLWQGPPDSPDMLLEKYNVDKILQESELAGILQKLSPQVVYIYDTTDASALFRAGLPNDSIDRHLLSVTTNEARLTKFPWEIDLLRYATLASSNAHVAVMKHVRPGRWEWELDARFRWQCARAGLLRQAYPPIIASGPRAATLHYMRNNQPVPTGEHTMVLIDAGGERRCYGSDITRTVPATGKFTMEARTIYEIVLRMQQAVLDRLRPGVLWRDMQLLVFEILTEELLRIGILKGSVEELKRLGLARAFLFHGLGHSVGLNVHDVGGSSAGIFSSTQSRIYAPEYSLLSRPLQENMVITVEPGLYFNETSLAMWTRDPSREVYFDRVVIEKYWPVGGVRIEDTVLITKDGIENFTTAPKQVSDIESTMLGYRHSATD